MNEKINALVKRLKKGKTRYFDEFYDLTKKAVYFTVFKILGTAAESNDVMQADRRDNGKRSARYTRKRIYAFQP